MTWKGGRETDTAKRGLAMEWELSGAPVTAFRHRETAIRSPHSGGKAGGVKASSAGRSSSGFD